MRRAVAPILLELVTRMLFSCEILVTICAFITARKIGFTQIYSGKIWSKKVQIRGKSKAKMVNKQIREFVNWLKIPSYLW